MRFISSLFFFTFFISIYTQLYNTFNDLACCRFILRDISFFFSLSSLISVYICISFFRFTSVFFCLFVECGNGLMISKQLNIPFKPHTSLPVYHKVCSLSVPQSFSISLRRSCFFLGFCSNFIFLYRRLSIDFGIVSLFFVVIVDCFKYVHIITVVVVVALSMLINISMHFQAYILLLCLLQCMWIIVCDWIHFIICQVLSLWFLSFVSQLFCFSLWIENNKRALGECWFSVNDWKVSTNNDRR